MSNFKDKYLKYKSKYLQLKNQLGGEDYYIEIPEHNVRVPKSFRDNSLLWELFFDPVVAIDGFTYERDSINGWFKNKNTSPATGAKLSNKDLIPNNTLKRAINEMVVLRESFPKSFLCHITGKLFINPVITADGETYEKAAIEDWFQRGNNTSPYTGNVLPNNDLLLNQTIKSSIDEIRIETGKSGKKTSIEYDDIYCDDGYNWFDINKEGFFRDGFNKDGFGRDRYNKEGYDKDGFGRDGFNKDGFNRDGLYKNGTNYDNDGYDIEGFNKEGLNREGLIKPPKCVVTQKGLKFGVVSVAFHPTGSFLATCSANFLKLWRFSPDGSALCCVEIKISNRGYIKSVVFHPTEPLLATGSGDNTVKLWRFSPDGLPSHMTCVATLRGHRGAVKSVVFHPSAPLLATGSEDKTTKLWRFSQDGSAACCVATLKEHRDFVNSVAFNPTYSLLVTCSFDATIKLWSFSPDGSVSDITCVATLYSRNGGHRYSVTSVAFHPTAPLLATGSLDWTVKLWRFSPDGSVSDITCVATLDRSNGGHKEAVTSIAFHTTMPLLATGSWDKTVKLWRFSPDGSMSDITCVATLNSSNGGHNSWINSVAFNSTYSLLVTSSNDETMKLWRLK